MLREEVLHEARYILGVIAEWRHNPRVDELLDRAAAIFDPERRKPLYQEAERLIVDDAPYVFLNYTAEFAVMSRRVQNWGWIPDLVPRFRDLGLEK